MSLSWCDLLEDINDFCVEITRAKVFKKDTEHFKEHVQSTLKLNKLNDWDYILASEDILEDSNAALKNFLKFGLNGPTKLDLIGEKYIRLYGVLNATYLQQEAIFNLVKYYQVPNPSLYKDSINKLEIRKLRNQLGAHSVNYGQQHEGEVLAFVPVRASMDDFKVDHFEHTSDVYHTVDLKHAIEEHLKLLCSIYIVVIKKVISTTYKSNSNKISSLLDCVKPFEAMLDGATLIKKSEKYSYVIIESVH